FPVCTEQQRASIRALGESLDSHRKRQQALYPNLTITEMYNVLEKLRAAAPLTDKERAIHEQGLVSVLRQIHDDLDAAVAEAYGWPADLSDEEILERLVALNAERAREERAGLIRWLRPEYQNPAGAVQSGFEAGSQAAEAATTSREEKLAWPKSLAEQARAVRAALVARQLLWRDDPLTGDQRGAHGPRLFSQRFRPSQFFFPARRGGFSRLTTGLEARLHRARRVLIFGPQPADQPRALLAGAFGVERDQPFQNLFIAQVCGPAVSLSHSRIQIVVDLSEYRYQPLLVNGTFLVGERSGGAQFFEDVVHLGDRQ